MWYFHYRSTVITQNRGGISAVILSLITRTAGRSVTAADGECGAKGKPDQLKMSRRWWKAKTWAGRRSRGRMKTIWGPRGLRLPFMTYSLTAINRLWIQWWESHSSQRQEEKRQEEFLNWGRVSEFMEQHNILFVSTFIFLFCFWQKAELICSQL